MGAEKRAPALPWGHMYMRDVMLRIYLGVFSGTAPKYLRYIGFSLTSEKKYFSTCLHQHHTWSSRTDKFAYDVLTCKNTNKILENQCVPPLNIQ